MARDRKRWRTDYPLTQNGSLTWVPLPGNQFDSGHYEYTATNFTFSEWMEDVVEPRLTSETALYPIHPCVHIRQKVAQLAESITWTDWNSVQEVVARDYHPASMDELFPPFPPATAQSEVGLQAFDEFADQVPSKVSLPNFLWELRDIKGLIPKMRGNFAKSANGAFLGYNFGILPFLSDLKKLRKSFAAIGKRIAFLRHSYGKPTKIHFFRGDFYDDPALGQRADPPTNDINQTLVWMLKAHKVDFRATGTLYQKLEGLDGAFSEWQAAAAQFGFNDPLKVVWEAIPYSFVVDWFANVQGMLDRFTVQPFEGVWEVSNVTSSFSSSSVIEGWIWPRRQFGNNWLLTHILHRRAYKRIVGLPVARLHLDTLSPKRQVLLGSLIYQRLGKH